MRAPLPLLLSWLGVLLAAPTPAPVPRCGYGATGDLVGHRIYLARGVLTPTSARAYNHSEPPLPGCVLNGASARACDVFAPEVAVWLEPGGGARVEVRRLGPRLHPLKLDVSFYCDPPSTTTDYPAPPLRVV